MSTILLNGQSKTIEAPLPLAQLVREMTGSETRTGIAAAVNEEVVPRADWETVVLEHGDRVEILGIVGGG